MLVTLANVHLVIRDSVVRITSMIVLLIHAIVVIVLMERIVSHAFAILVTPVTCVRHKSTSAKVIHVNMGATVKT